MILSKFEAIRIIEHLKRTNQAFCFYDGVLVSRQDCEKVITESR